MFNILYQFNDKYAPYAGVSITSLFENNRDTENITIWILGEKISDVNCSRLNKTAKNYSDDFHVRRIVFVNSDSIIKEIEELGIPSYRGSQSANIRMFVSEFIPITVDRLLYLDSDTIINSSIENLFSADLGNKTIAMVIDSVGESHKPNINLLPEDEYYNSGVILFDMKRWRERDYTMKIVSHVKTVRAQYASPDQDLLNVVCKGDIFTLPPKMNYQPSHAVYSDKIYFKNYAKTKYYSIEEIVESRNTPIIFHCFRFVGEFPWDKNNTHPFNDVFDRALEISEWADYKKCYSNNGIAMKIEKIIYKVLPHSLFLRLFCIVRELVYRNENKKVE